MDDQIPGQMSIEDCLAEAEKQRKLLAGEYVDLGEKRADGSYRTSWERWPNGAPT